MDTVVHSHDHDLAGRGVTSVPSYAHQLRRDRSHSPRISVRGDPSADRRAASRRFVTMTGSYLNPDFPDGLPV